MWSRSLFGCTANVPARTVAWGIDLFFGIPAVGFRAITASKTSPWPLYFGIAANSTEHTQQAPPGWIQACIREQTVRHAS